MNLSLKHLVPLPPPGTEVYVDHRRVVDREIRVTRHQPVHFLDRKPFQEPLTVEAETREGVPCILRGWLRIELDDDRLTTLLERIGSSYYDRVASVSASQVLASANLLPLIKALVEQALRGASLAELVDSKGLAVFTTDLHGQISAAGERHDLCIETTFTVSTPRELDAAQRARLATAAGMCRDPEKGITYADPVLGALYEQHLRAGDNQKWEESRQQMQGNRLKEELDKDAAAIRERDNERQAALLRSNQQVGLLRENLEHEIEGAKQANAAERARRAREIEHDENVAAMNLAEARLSRAAQERKVAEVDAEIAELQHRIEYRRQERAEKHQLAVMQELSKGLGNLPDTTLPGSNQLAWVLGGWMTNWVGQIVTLAATPHAPLAAPQAPTAGPQEPLPSGFPGPVQAGGFPPSPAPAAVAAAASAHLATAGPGSNISVTSKPMKQTAPLPPLPPLNT